MLQVIINLLTFNALNTPPEIYAGLGAAWVLLMSAGIASVVTRKCLLVVKLVWLVLIVGLPVAGLLVYCIWCVISADYSFLKMFGLHRQTASYLGATSQKKTK
jgi:hypothetical protein